VREQLQRHRDLTLQLIWEEYRQKHPEATATVTFASGMNAGGASRIPEITLAGLLSISFFLLITVWVTPENRARGGATSRLYCFTAGFSRAPYGCSVGHASRIPAHMHKPADTPSAAAELCCGKLSVMKGG
jgi:hypothetical protein